MPRLLRVHYASIGHRDARLSPLTIDLRGKNGEGGVDSVLWLRNGGGKSSIINLFYSVFRPNTREFLGSSAEGKARRLDQYVKSDDLAFVITEWDVRAQRQDTLFSELDADVRIVGQMLAWRGQQRSADTSKLRRLFFSLRTDDSIVTFDSLPIVGLGDPAESFDAFTDWLRQMSHRHASLEITETKSQQVWGRHLEEIGLDPEIFKYQLQMNRREGAADEVFRFNAAADFIKFFLGLSFDTLTASQLARNLEAQRESLKQRPRYELERAFISAALEALQPLAQTLSMLDELEADLRRTLGEIAATLGGVERQAEALWTSAEAAAQQARQAEARALAARNDADRKRRWSRGLERLALQLDEQAAERALQDALELAVAFDRELAEVKAAVELAKVRALEAERAELEVALRRVEADAEPLRLEAEARGIALVALLDLELEALGHSLDELRSRAVQVKADVKSARSRGDEARAEAAALNEEIRYLDQRLRKREQARKRLVDEGLIDLREPAEEALARWTERVAELERRGEAAATAVGALLDERERAQARIAALGEQIAEHRSEHKALSARLDEATVWRERLATDPLVAEIEGVDEGNIEAAGLEQRIRDHAEVARRQVLQSQVDGVEDRRALAAIDQSGLLPSSTDVERVVEALRQRGINAHCGSEYLGENFPSERSLGLLTSDPARFSGAIIVDEAGFLAAADVEVENLRVPVQISWLRDADAERELADARVLPPEAGHYDPQAALARREPLESLLQRREAREVVLSRRERALDALAGELRRYLRAYGDGALQRLSQRVDDRAQLQAAAESERQEVEARRDELAARLESKRREREQLEKEERQASRAAQRLQIHVDEHEVQLAQTRGRRDEALGLRQRAQGAAEQAALDEEQAAERLETIRERERSLTVDAREVKRERQAVRYVGQQAIAPAISLEQARAAYATTSEQLERRLGENKISWRIDEVQKRLAQARDGYDRLAHGLDRDSMERRLGERDLPRVVIRLERERRAHDDEVGAARERRRAAKEALKRVSLRREVDDLPTDRPPPKDAAAARALGGELQAEAELDVAAQRRAEAEQHDGEARAAAQRREAERQRALGDRLCDLVETSTDLVLPAAEPSVAVPSTMAELEPHIARQRERFLKERDGRRSARDKARVLAETVQRVANDARFADLEAKYRERLRAAADELFSTAPALKEAVGNRLTVIERQLAQYDEDRLVLVNEMIQIADQVADLFKRTRSASTLPSTLDGWAGRPYLRIGFSFPEALADRRARLEPLVDRLVQKASIPDGLELVCLASQELAGSAGFEVKILKPDSVLRPDPISITAMSTFSRGQQLTAAILLYCTLVQLRARSRGRGRGARDAGVLILDNPIGTCSSVALLELQRSIAQQMKVQLIYATGVDDLEALDVLPNKIRLRNTHRDRRSGDFFVTEEEEGGQVEAVRVSRGIGP